MRIRRGVPWLLLGTSWLTIGGASFLYGIVMLVVATIAGPNTFGPEIFLPFGIWIGLSLSGVILLFVWYFLTWLGQGWYNYLVHGKDLDR